MAADVVTIIKTPILKPTEYRNLIISTLNCKGFKSNSRYTLKIAYESDITFIQETWLKNSDPEIATMRNVNREMKFDFHSSMADNERTIGRPYGGIGWIIKKHPDIKFEVKHHSNRVSECRINNNLTIIGIYATANNNTLNGRMSHEEDLIHAMTLVNKAEVEGRKTMLIGDLNSDLRRLNSHDKILKKCSQDYELTSISTLFVQNIGYTFKCSLAESTIDHVLITNKSAYMIKSCNIVQSPTNLSDHNAIVTEIFIEKDKQLYKSKKRKPKPKWSDHSFKYEYQQAVELEMNRTQISFNETNDTGQQQEMLHLALKKALETTMKTSNKAQKSQKKKSWWNSNFEVLNDEIRFWYLRYRESGWLDQEARVEWTKKKREFRKIQRITIKTMNQQELKKINELMRLNRDEFWKEIKLKRKPSIPVNASTKQLVEKYTDLFNKNNESYKF